MEENDQSQQVHVEIDPNNPFAVIEYLTKLCKDNKLDLASMQGRDSNIPVKEWMEKCYPDFFTVFPQNPRLLTELADDSEKTVLLYSQYWLFLFEVRNILTMDSSVTPEYVISLGESISSLEDQGFDCRFMRTQMLVVANILMWQYEATLAEKCVIEKRKQKVEKAFGSMKGGPGESSNKMMTEENQGSNFTLEGSLPCKTKGKDLFKVIEDRHEKIIAWKGDEEKRLFQVVQLIHQLL
ncbi:hypothetical protein LINPERHAP2_LOCUS6163 [Linum perenne]